jgi:glycerol-3-phosphate acyltransferase PlsY
MEILALLLGYLIGSLPTAYLVARLKSGGDPGALREGNVGGLNTIRQVSLSAGILVIIIDICKGAAAVLLAYYILKVGTAFVLGAGVAAIIGHNWMIWLRFRGGRGMAAAIGVISASALIYGYAWIILIIMAIILIFWIVARNIVLGNAIALITLPFMVYFGTGSTLATYMAIALVAVIAIKFAPAAISDIKRRGLKGLGPDKIEAKKKSPDS